MSEAHSGARRVIKTHEMDAETHDLIMNAKVSARSNALNYLMDESINSTMVEAGVAVLASFQPDDGIPDRDRVGSIYLAMKEA